MTRRHCGMLFAAAFAAALAQVKPAAADAITLRGETAHYLLVLEIDRIKDIYTPTEARIRRPTEGEIIVGGRLAPAPHNDMVGGMDTQATSAPIRHLGLHVAARASGNMVAEAHVTIAIAGADKKARSVPIARMYSVTQGPDDLHYGNNFPLPPGAYTVSVAVNGEKARFSVMVPAEF